MSKIPRSHLPDDTLSLAKNGYLFISDRCRKYHTDLFLTRIMLEKTVCMLGKDAAELFYDSDRFKRSGVVPDFILATLFGHGGVQGLDGAAHQIRKKMFMELMSAESGAHLKKIAEQQWRRQIRQWEQKNRIILFYEVQKLICRAVCQWTGVPLHPEKVQLRTNDLAAMIDGAGSVGLRHWKARRARNRTEQWIEKLVEQVRNRNLKAGDHSALYKIAWHRDADDNLLDAHTAAVELINILRPAVAVSRFITFAALAMHHHPVCKEKLRFGDKEYLRFFIHEVRRFYPFFPFVVASVKRDFKWKGYEFHEGLQVMLDLYGTNHDSRIWDNPDEFLPERFEHWDGSSYNFIPQGGGNHFKNHRCPGELPTIKLMEAGINVLANELRYVVPAQNLDINLSRMPAIPHSRFIITEIHAG